MLIRDSDKHESHVNPNFIIKAWRTRNDLRDSGYEYYVRLRWYDNYFIIDQDSYERIVAWLDAQ